MEHQRTTATVVKITLKMETVGSHNYRSDKFTKYSDMFLSKSSTKTFVIFQFLFSFLISSDIALTFFTQFLSSESEVAIRGVLHKSCS